MAGCGFNFVGAVFCPGDALAIPKNEIGRRPGPMKMCVEIRSQRAWRIALAAMALALTAVSPAHAAPFRQLPETPVIPPSITYPAERDILQADLDRVKASISEYNGRLAEYRRDCDQRLLTNAATKRECSSFAQGLHREASRLQVAINALRNRFSVIERGARQRRHATDPALRAAATGALRDNRPGLVAEALAAGDGSWDSVLDHVKAMRDRGAGDPAVRDVYAYLTGIHSGRLAADTLENEYYKYGVRRSLAGDYWSATLAFAQAARDTPGDRRVFESFATAAGRQHAAPACITSGRCVSGNVAEWAKRFGTGHDGALKQVDAAYQKETLDPKTTGVFRILKAIAVYAAKKETEPAAESTRKIAIREMARQALAAARGGDRFDAVRRYIRLWELTEPDRAAVFLVRYAETSGSAEARAMSEIRPRPSAPPANRREYLERLRQAFTQGDNASPFSGALTRAQIIRLQR